MATPAVSIALWTVFNFGTGPSLGPAHSEVGPCDGLDVGKRHFGCDHLVSGNMGRVECRGAALLAASRLASSARLAAIAMA